MCLNFFTHSFAVQNMPLSRPQRATSSSKGPAPPSTSRATNADLAFQAAVGLALSTGTDEQGVGAVESAGVAAMAASLNTIVVARQLPRLKPIADVGPVGLVFKSERHVGLPFVWHHQQISPGQPHLQWSSPGGSSSAPSNPTSSPATPASNSRPPAEWNQATPRKFKYAASHRLGLVR